MDTRYIYGTSRIRSLAEPVISGEEINRLFSVKTTDDFFKELKNTYFVSYVSEEEKDISGMIERSLAEAKRTVMNSAPEPALLDICWIRYDFYNLAVIAKAGRTDTSDEKIIPQMSRLGKYEPEKILNAVREEKLHRLEREFSYAWQKALDCKRIFEIDLIMENYFFHALRRMAESFRNPFISRFVKLQIDNYNLRSRMRLPALARFQVSDVFIEGGNIGREEMESPEQSINALKSKRSKRFEEAVEEYKEYNRTTLLEAYLRERVIYFLKEESRDVFSPAPLFLFFFNSAGAAQAVRGVFVAREGGFKDVRALL